MSGVAIQRLMVVGEEPGISDAIGIGANMMGFATWVTYSFKEFQGRYDVFNPTHVAIDLDMRSESGLELIDWVGQKPGAPHLVLVSQDPQLTRTAVALSEARKLKVLQTLDKPFLLHDLRRALGAEEQRLAALRSYEILDTQNEERFDRIVRMAARLFGSPIALISLVDRDRQWFKAAVGLDAKETSRTISFCTHAIQQRGVFVVGDAAADPRFADNPLVTGAPNIGFYAGAPLVTPEGHAIGTLCVIDRSPWLDFPGYAQEALQDYAGVIMDWLEADRKVRALTIENAQLRTQIERRR